MSNPPNYRIFETITANISFLFITTIIIFIMYQMTNYLRKNWLLAFAFPVFIGGVMSCSSDDGYSPVDNQAPTITLASDHVQTEAGRAFTIAGVIKDADGIKSINLKNEGMLLDKTINLLELYSELQKEYNLSYTYQKQFTKDWNDASSFPVTITVEDVVGNKQTATVMVSADGDFTNPTFVVAPSEQVTVLVGPAPKFKLNCQVSDNKVLKNIHIVSAELGIDEVVETGNVSSYTLAKEYVMPGYAIASYPMTITVNDTFDNETSTSTTINVSEMPDFEKMYLADVETAAELSSDVYGVPMLIDHTGEFEYTARYYNQKSGTKVRFIPQMTDFEPICFGPYTEDTSKFSNDPSSVEGLVLNEIGYYEIKFNINTGEYSYKTYTPEPITVKLSGNDYTYPLTLNGTTTWDFGDGSGDQPAQICLAGSNLPNDTPGWTTNQNNNAYILLQDEKNPYLLYREDTYEEGKNIEFTISATHWWGWWPEPFWRFDGSEFNEKNTLNGGDNMKGSGAKVPATGKYRFEFDYHLLRSRLIPVK